MATEDTQKLRRCERIQIAWVSCHLEERAYIPCCQKCQRIGHRAKECNFEPVANKRCHKCGKIGHTVKKCTADPKCYNCEAANTAACPIYRKHLAASRKKGDTEPMTTQYNDNDNDDDETSNRRSDNRRERIQHTTTTGTNRKREAASPIENNRKTLNNQDGC